MPVALVVDSTDPAIGTVKMIGDEIVLRVSNVEQLDPEDSSTPTDDPTLDDPYGPDSSDENSDSTDAGNNPDTPDDEESSNDNGWWPFG